MSLLRIKKLFTKSTFSVKLIFIVTFLVLFLIMITSRVTKTYSILVGDIAKEDIEATREVTDLKSTNLLIEEAINGVALQYSKKTDVKTKAVNDISSLLNEIIQLKDTNIDEKSKIDKFRNDLSTSITDTDIKSLLSSSKDDLKNLQLFLVKTISSLYDVNNIEEDAGDNTTNVKDSSKRATDYILIAFNTSPDTEKFSKQLKEVGINISDSVVKPNFFYDKDKTEQLKKEAEKKVTPVIIKKDQLIVKKGEPVTANQLNILKELGLLNNDNNFDWYIYGCLAGLVLFILILEWYYLFKYQGDIFNERSKLILLNLLTIISLILSRSLTLISPFLIPFACAPILMTLLLNHKVSLNISILNCVLISAVVGFKADITILAVVNSAFSVVVMRKMQERNDILYAAIPFSIINVLITFFVGFLVSNNTLDVLIKSGFSLISSIISCVLAIGFLPFFESAFDIVTIVKLLELSNPNNPLLKRLLLEAPGTYHHSLLVANLAEVAAEKVGGNTVLTRVASYYHDVGKIKRPYFFKENQLGNDNPHDKITPNLSALIIISHVKDGLELAREYKIPKVIQDIIEQHHGTYLVKYFYLIVKNSSERPEEIEESNFRYQGPIPTTKECAIIMMADAVEASVRSISSPTNGKIEEMVNNIIKQRLNEGQLDHCDLTLKDIDIIRKSFLQSLSGIYHKRIEYPSDKWQNKKIGEM